MKFNEYTKDLDKFGEHPLLVLKESKTYNAFLKYDHIRNEWILNVSQEDKPLIVCHGEYVMDQCYEPLWSTRYLR